MALTVRFDGMKAFIPQRDAETETFDSFTGDLTDLGPESLCTPSVDLRELSNQNQAMHFDTGKPRVDLLPARGLLAVGDVMAFGATKYAARNWEKGMPFSKLLGSTLRHLLAVMAGERMDRDSGLPHLAHAATDILMILSLDANKWDDLP